MGSSDRRPYETATVLDQALLDECAGNLVCDLRMLALISVPTGAFVTDTLYLSDRNMIVGENFYQARIKFPPILRDLGELLTPQITFSNLTIEVSNVDGFFNSILPSGDYYHSFVGRQIIVKLGLAEVQSTYDANIIFDGFVTEVGGFSRSVTGFTLIARNKFDSLKTLFPTTSFTVADYPSIGDDVRGKPKPFIMGDWTTNLEIAKGASVPGLVVNGADANMNGETSNTNNVQCVISENTNRLFDTTNVVLLRSELAYVIDTGDIANVNANKNYFEIVQNGTTLVEGVAFIFKSSDKFFVKVKGQSIAAGDLFPDNAVQQARYILENFGGAAPSDFTANWDTLRAKASPSQSAIVNIPCRYYSNKAKPALDEALSILEQIRCEAYVDRSQDLDLQTIHWEDFNDSPSIVVRNQDIEMGSFKPVTDNRNNFNRAAGFYNLLPDINEEYQTTVFRKNDNAISEQGKEITKGIVFPNLYIDSDVQNQLDEYLKLTSGGKENVLCNQTWRVLALDLGDWVSMDVKIQSVTFDNVPCWIRSITFNSVGMKLSLNYFSFQLLPFKTWNPGYTGIVGGQSASIT